MDRLKKPDAVNSAANIERLAKMEKAEDRRKNIEIFKHLKDPGQLEYKRLITVFDQNKERALQRAHNSTFTCM